MIEAKTAAAISRHAAELRGVSRERIGDELRRMLGHPAAAARAKAIELIEQLGLDAPVLNEPARGRGSLRVLERLEVKCPELGTVLAGWCIERNGATEAGMDANQIKGVCVRWRAALCLSNEESLEFSDVLEIHAALVRRWQGMPVAARKRLAARGAFGGAAAIVGAVDAAAAARIAGDIKGLEQDGIGICPEPLITGEDLIAIGLAPGPVFKRILDEVMDSQLEGRVRDKAAAMELVRKLSV
jgi:poly(A) polymerase